MKHQYKPLFLLCLMFLTVGAMFTMNDILLPVVKEYFSLTYTQATLIQVSFYITYIIFPIPIAILINRYGYKVSLLVALATCVLGCLLFYPAQLFNSYTIVLLGIFTLSTGITIINVSANPLTALLGEPEGSHIRINFVQAFSRIGYAITPIFATAFIFRNTGEVVKFYLPYVALALLIFFIGILIRFSSMPSMKSPEYTAFNIKQVIGEAKQHRHLIFGIVAMFFYVGAEACTAGFFIPYLTTELGYSVTEASGYLTLYYVFAAIMGLIAAIWLLRYFKAHIIVGVFAIAMVVIYGICIGTKTGYNEYLLASLGLGLSIMFPTLFSLAIEDLGSFSANGSALLNFAIVGGAVFTPIQGLIADSSGVSISYIVPLICFVIISIYAFFFTKDSLPQRKLEKNKYSYGKPAKI